MAKVRIKVDGLSELKRKLDKLPEELRRYALNEAAKAGAQPIRDEAARLAPRASSPSHPELGHLADHIAVFEPTKTAKGVSVRQGPAAGYYWGRYLEFGTSKMPAQPFMRPAFDANKEAAVEAEKEALAKSILKVARGS